MKHISQNRIAEIAAIPNEDIDLSEIPEQDEEAFARARRKSIIERNSEPRVSEWPSAFHLPRSP